MEFDSFHVAVFDVSEFEFIFLGVYACCLLFFVTIGKNEFSIKVLSGSVFFGSTEVTGSIHMKSQDIWRILSPYKLDLVKSRSTLPKKFY